MVDNYTTTHNLEQSKKAAMSAYEQMKILIRKPINLLDKTPEAQRAILQEIMTHASTSFEMLAKTGSPSEIVNQADLARQASERALGNMRELAEMLAKSHQEAVNAVNSRIAQALDDIKQMASKFNEPPTTKTGQTSEK